LDFGFFSFGILNFYTTRLLYVFPLMAMFG